MSNKDEILKVLSQTKEGLTVGEITITLMKMGIDPIKDPNGLISLHESLASLTANGFIICEKISEKEIYRINKKGIE